MAEEGEERAGWEGVREEGRQNRENAFLCAAATGSERLPASLGASCPAWAPWLPCSGPFLFSMKGHC